MLAQITVILSLNFPGRVQTFLSPSLASALCQISDVFAWFLKLYLLIFLQSIRPYLMNGLLFANGFNSIAINKAKTDVADDIVRFHTRAFDEEVERVIVSFCYTDQIVLTESAVRNGVDSNYHSEEFTLKVGDSESLEILRRKMNFFL